MHSHLATDYIKEESLARIGIVLWIMYVLPERLRVVRAVFLV